MPDHVPHDETNFLADFRATSEHSFELHIIAKEQAFNLTCSEAPERAATISGLGMACSGLPAETNHPDAHRAYLRWQFVPNIIAPLTISPSTLV